MTRPAAQLGEGPLHRAATVTYWFLAIEVLLVLTTAPGLVAMLFLDRDASNLALYALAAVPLGPAIGAAVFAWRAFDADRDQSPASAFWRGYRLGWRDALASWLPALILLVVLGTNLAYRDAAGIPATFAPLSVVLAVVAALWGVRMLTLTATFSFRWRDAARLSLHTLVTRPLVTLGLLSLLVLAGGIAFLAFDAVVVLLASVLTFFLARNERPVLASVQARFVARPPAR